MVQLVRLVADSPPVPLLEENQAAIPPPLPPAAFPVMVQFLTLRVPLPMYTPPPLLPAVLPEMVQPVRFAVPPWTFSAPPLPFAPATELPEIVQLVRFSVPAFWYTAPP